MGIPSYFSYIIKNYSNIIRNLSYHKNENTTFDSLFMDCNSIIYDVYNEMKNIIIDIPSLEKKIISCVIKKIELYIDIIKPHKLVYIAFDGVAPFAKMEQQRTRRYKSLYMNKLNIKDESLSLWNTSAITPGTEFMCLLTKKIKKHFQSCKNYIVSGSDEPGEGEHKMIDYIRKNAIHDENILIYGLDSDLIMLSIFHHNLCNNIYVFREAPEFLKSKVIHNSDNNDLLFMDIRELSNSIMIEMSANEISRTYDYIFLCFFLGNDFLPHFPCLNIRTSGIQILMETYRKYIGNFENRYFISKDSGKIQWKWVKLFLLEISKLEHDYILKEFHVRNRYDNYKWEQTTLEEKENVLMNVPIIYRADEKYIYPLEHGWEDRYYRRLFKLERTSENVKKISINYLSGLEWVFKYYTSGCSDWKWKYNYNYPPLFTDLIKYIPEHDFDFIINKNTSFSPKVQLAYVIPIHNHHLLDKKNSIILKEKYSHYFCENFDFQWAYCRYFWESHIILPEIPESILEIWEKELK